jgi:hypothetical protein
MLESLHQHHLRVPPPRSACGLAGAAMRMKLHRWQELTQQAFNAESATAASEPRSVDKFPYVLCSEIHSGLAWQDLDEGGWGCTAVDNQVSAFNALPCFAAMALSFRCSLQGEQRGCVVPFVHLKIFNKGLAELPAVLLVAYAKFLGEWQVFSGAGCI